MCRLAIILTGLLIAAPVFSRDIDSLALEQFLNTAPEMKVSSPTLEFPAHTKDKLKNCTPVRVSTSSLRKRFNSAKVKVYCDDLRQLSFYADFNGFVDVYVSKNIHKKGMPLSSINLKKEKVSLQDLKKGYFNGTSSPQLYSLKKNMKIGDVLYDKHLSLIYDVPLRSAAKAIINVGSINIESDVISKNNGMRGEVILVENINSGKEFLATVIGKGLVRVK